MNPFSNLLLTVVGLLGLLTPTQAQHSPQQATMHHCGISAEDQFLIRERLFENRRQSAELSGRLRSNDTLYIPVVAHLTADNEGNGRYRVRSILDNLCKLNADFEDQRIRFFLKSGYFNEINSDALYYHSDFNTAQFLMDTYKEPGAINMFVVEGISFLGNPVSYYSPTVDAIALSEGDILPNLTAMAHEVGHYLSLPHTFFGWETTSYPDGTVAPVTVSYEGQNIYVETQARSGTNSNCHIAADGFCGTQPNYYFGPGLGCSYTGNAIDPTGATVTTDADNIMSYFPQTCVNKFSQDQKDAMRSDAIARGYNTTQPPTKNEVANVAPTLLSPVDSNVVYNPDLVHFNWEPVSGASHYLVLVEIAMIPGVYGFFSSTIVDNQTEAWVSVHPNQVYRWSVYPYNPYDFCGNTTSTKASFHTLDWAVGVESLVKMEDWQLYPNPLKKGERLFMEMRSGNNAKLQLSIQDALGLQVLAPRTVALTQGQNTIAIETTRLAAGLYYLSLMTDTGMQSKTFIIQ